GAVFVPGASVGRVLKLIQEYDNHKNAYPSNVIDSKIISRKGNDLTVYLRLLERKGGITVVLDTDYEVEYRPLGNGDWRSRSYSTRIQEVENAGRRNERRKPAGEGRGYLWALNTYWLFRERDGGAYVECEAVSLSRGLPPILSFMARSIVRGLPRGFLQNTLEDTRDLVLGKPPRVRR
ncbi:MAG: hypothetical protein LAQ30_03895, partial [Acidobacteriia bacterium]|nr:hypothetical protein [Terriglobia bacterium]